MHVFVEPNQDATIGLSVANTGPDHINFNVTVQTTSDQSFSTGDDLEFELAPGQNKNLLLVFPDPDSDFIATVLVEAFPDRIVQRHEFYFDRHEGQQFNSIAVPSSRPRE